MALVGDVIMDMRNLGPDMPQVFPAPVISLADVPGGGTLPGSTYFIVLTALTPWGESLPSLEQSVTVATNDAIRITFFDAAGNTGSYRAYFGTTTGTESFFVQLGPNATSPVTITDFSQQQAGAPPVRSTAFLPDTDGGFVGAFTAYRWLNEALKKATLITGGIQDWGGANSVANQPMYRPATGVWRKFDACWYDGWELEQGNKAEIFRNRPITASISRMFCVDVNSAGQVVELYYIPSRSGAVTTTSASFASTATSVSLTSVGGFSGPPFGLVQIGSEVCFYASVQGNQLTGLTRGLSGTVIPSTPDPQPSGLTVKELNILWNGYRLPAVYSSGQSAMTLDVPQGWETILVKYMLGKFREAEQSRQEAASLFKEFEGEFKALAYSNKQLAGARQARIFDSFGFRGVIPASAGGGLIIR